MDLFEKAVFNRWRFASSAGLLSVEDIVSLPLEHKRSACLEEVAQNLHKETQEQAISFVHKTNANTLAMEKLELVKYIIDKRIKAAKAKEEEAIKAKRIKELEKLAQEKRLANASAEDIEKEIAALKAS